MSQAEVAGGTITSHGELPAKGRCLRDFTLISSSGTTLRLSDYRGRTNLVLILSDETPETKRLLLEAARRYTEIKDEQAEVLAIMCQSAAAAKQALELPYPVLADEDGRVHRELGATDLQGNSSAAAYVTDRFGEVFGLYRTLDRQSLPDVAAILKWLEFINAQCPECEPPEWSI